MLVECHGTVEEEGICVGRVSWYCGGEVEQSALNF